MASAEVLTQDTAFPRSPAAPLPARALRARLQAAAEPPAWASFLPPQLQRPAEPSAPSERPVDALAPPPRGRSALRADAPAFELPCAPGACGSGQIPKAPPPRGPGGGPRPAVRRDVWALSQDPAGCHQVQDAFEHGSDEERQQLAGQLRGHVWEALRCPHANHVLQKCITASRPRYTQFVADEIMEKSNGAAMAARMRFGCRILERQLEHYPAEQVGPLLDGLLGDAAALCTHLYGNYVMQHILEHGPPEHKHRLCRLLEPHVRAFGHDQYACAVLGKALCHGSREDQACIAHAILREPDLLCRIAQTRYGHVAAKLVLQVTEGPLLREARAQVAAEAHKLRSLRYGRFVVQCLEQQSRGPPAQQRQQCSLTQRAGGA